MRPKKTILTATDEEAFLAGLKTGLGLTKSCEMISKTPKDMSEYIKANVDFMQKCVEAVTYSAKALTLMAAEKLNKKKYREWADASRQMNEFVTELVLWESYCTRANVNEGKAMTAIMTRRNKGEAATSMGLSVQELNDLLVRSPILREFMNQNNINLI